MKCRKNLSLKFIEQCILEKATDEEIYKWLLQDIEMGERLVLDGEVTGLTFL